MGCNEVGCESVGWIDQVSVNKDGGSVPEKAACTARVMKEKAECPFCAQVAIVVQMRSHHCRPPFPPCVP